MMTEPTSAIEIRCESKEEAIELAKKILKSGVLKDAGQMKVYTSVYFCD